jgi:hypothetical protein
MGAVRKQVLLLACGALARDLVTLQRLNRWESVKIDCLSASLHFYPEKIPAAVRAKLEEAKDRFDQIFVAYADCGTAGKLDQVLAEYGAERLPGADCFEFYAGAERFAALQDAEPGTFYLTDFLVRHFDRLVIRSLGIDRHPELLPMYFGNYKRAVFLAQMPSPEAEAQARECASRLGLEFDSIVTGLDPLDEVLSIWVGRSGIPEAPH